MIKNVTPVMLSCSRRVVVERPV